MTYVQAIDAKVADWSISHAWAIISFLAEVIVRPLAGRNQISLRIHCRARMPELLF
jgi:hypothetical protein